MLDYISRPHFHRSSQLDEAFVLEGTHHHQEHQHQGTYAKEVVPQYTTDDFHMHSVTFEQLHQELNQTDPGLAKKFSGGNAPATLEKCALITLWHLANQDSMRSIRVKFGVEKSTIQSIVHRVTTAIGEDGSEIVARSTLYDQCGITIQRQMDFQVWMP